MSAPTAIKTIDSLLTNMHHSKHQAAKSQHRVAKVDRPETVRAFEYRNQLIVASQFVLQRIGTASIGIVLGSGLGGFGNKLRNVEELKYSEIPFLPQPTVKGHSGKIIMGYLQSKDGQTKKRIMCFSGRLHSYEGYPMYQVTFCARLAYLCGCHTLILTNAAGGCIPNQEAGSVVIMTDYIRDVNYTILAHSSNDQMFGVRHMKCNKVLDNQLTQMLITTAKECDFPYYSGTYWWCMGPCYETASQIQFSIQTGAHAVGMSTVPSILAAHNIGLRVAAMSLCTNVAAGLADEILCHDVVISNAEAAAVNFTNFVEAALLKITSPNNNDMMNDYHSQLDNFKLNLSQLTMNIDTASFDEFIFPRKYIGTYSDLYKDIAFIRSFLSNVLDLNISPMKKKKSTHNIQRMPPAIETAVSSITPPGGGNEKQFKFDNTSEKKTKEFQAPIDFAPPAIKVRSQSHGHVSHTFSSSHHNKSFQMKGHIVENIRNRDGPIPIWILHDPFKFDTTRLQCPISVPLKTLSGFNCIITSTSARNAILNFGFDSHYNLIVVIVGLQLGGFSFDECNYIINVLYGVLGHKNLYFTNMFYAFPTKTMYSEEKEEKEEIERGQYALIKDSVDFKGGFPRFPSPLFPPKEINTSDCYVRMKYGVFGSTKTTDSQVECLKGFKGFFDNLNTNHKTNIYSYAYWSGPNFPSLAELNISAVAGCELTGISNPFMTPMCRQLGHDGYSVAYVGTKKEFNSICSTQSEAQCCTKDVTQIIFSISSSIIIFFKSSACLFSPASMNRNKPSIFQASTITDKRLHKELSLLNIPYKAPQHQVLHTVSSEWSFINEAAEWLSNVWNFQDHSIYNSLFSSFSHIFEQKQKQKFKPLISINLSNIPGWKEHHCGGYPYSHYHWNNDNPFEWTLKIFRYDYEHELFEPRYYIAVAPHFFTNTGIHPQRYAYMTSFYKYTPRFWNLSFIVRVLWKLGVKNICFLSHLIGNNCDKNLMKNAPKTLPINSVVLTKNYIECARWNILTGPNDKRMGPRFTPITDPVELEDDFIKGVIQNEKFKFKKNIPSVITVHVPSSATISQTTNSFYGKLGYQTSVLGLIPCIQTSQHLGLKKLCVGITDYTIDEKLNNVKSFYEIVQMIETLFSQLEPKDMDVLSKQKTFMWGHK
eukprot:261589_1